MQVRELKELPRKIEALETEQNELYEIMSDPQFYKTDKSRIAIVQTRLDEVGHEIEEHFSRWEELEKIEKGTNQT
jgi:ABC transport system ATP-binding/permease protein